MSGRPRKAGVLGPQVEGYRAWLAPRGYTPGTIKNMLNDLGRVGRWSAAQGLDAAQLDEDRMAVFLTARRAAGHRKVSGTRGMAPLLSYLRAAGVVAVAEPVMTPLGVLLDRYRSWLVGDRGLAATTVRRYENTARRFLGEQTSAEEGVEPAGLSGVDVNAFLLRECGRVSAGSAKGRVAELRSILKFLYVQGITALPLGAAVPPVGGWRFATLPPPTMAAGDVQRLLNCCDRSSPVGIRNFAIMTLVARLGLRSVEVVRLELSDVDWRGGELVVRGKGRRHDRLPLPAEVGEALVAYLSCGRNPAGARHVFLTCRAGTVGGLGAGDVQQHDVGTLGRAGAGGVDAGGPGALDDPGDDCHGDQPPMRVSDAHSATTARIRAAGTVATPSRVNSPNSALVLCSRTMRRHNRVAREPA
jgi:site-specific recombinase XerD